MADTQDALLLKRRARRRLVGAIALVLFVVIVLPIVLDQEPRPARHDLTVQIPSQDAGKFGGRVLQKLEAPKATEGSAAASAPAPAAGEPAKIDPKVSEPGPKTPDTSKGSSGDKPAPRSVAKESPKKTENEAKRALALLNDEAYVVPLGTFGNTDYARQAQDKASAAGFKTYTEKISGKDGDQTRVRAGPFDTRESAEKAREKLKALGLPVGQVAQR